MRVEPAGEDRARLVLEHVGHVDDELWATYGPGATGIGWDLALLGLHLHLEGGGAAVDPAEVAAWTASPDGRRMIEGAGRGWADADIAAGTPPETANAAATNATAFYTGGE